MVEEKITFPGSLRAYFDSAHSSLNPYNRNEGAFAYGSLPMVMAKAIGPIFGKKGYGGAHLVGRALSGIFDLITVWLVYRITRRFTHRRAALFSAGLSAFCVLGIQLSHFWSVDTFLTSFTAATLLGAVRIAQGRGGWRGSTATGIALGLAAACKITALALLFPVGVAVLVHMIRSGAPVLRSLSGAVARLFLIVVTAAVTVRIFLPYIFLGPSPFSFRLDPRWIDDIRRLALLSSSVAGFPPALQWAGRTILFPVENFVLWGAGVFFGISALLAAAWTAMTIVKRRAFDLAPLLAHVLFLFLYHGLTIVKSIRYLYPAYPALAVLTGVFFSSLLTRTAWPRPARAAAVLVLGGTFLWALAFTVIYRRPHTRIEASRWIYSHVPQGKRFANESWDDGQPLGLAPHDAGRYAGPSLALFDPDSPRKVDEIVKALTEADWIAVTSNRVYGNVTRIPAIFPMSIAYYRALFDGSLGFERAADFVSYPTLGPLRFPDDRAEEQFTVYDHPRVLLFRKTPRFSPEKAKAMLLASIPSTPPIMNDWERWPRSLRRVTEPVRPDHRAEVEKAPSVEPGEGGSLGAAVAWYLALLLVGALAAPLCWAAFPRLPDRGLGFARIAGLVTATYLFMMALTLHLLPNSRKAAAVCLAILAIGSASVFLRNRHDFLRFLRENRRTLLASEAVFAAGFLIFLGFRALNPEIYWGEKPMDFSILNILVRTRSLPASDPWFAGAPLGYYVFGQEMIVLLTLLTNLSTRFTFNLAFGLLGGAILQGAFALGRNWGRTLRAGIAGGSLMLLLGNLSGPREWLINKRALDWDYFWATSRVIRDTINEYPLWSLLFADLHAHVLAIPIFLLFAAAALHLVRLHAEPVASWGRRLTAAVLLGFLACAQALTNAWDVPLLSGLLVLIAMITAFMADRFTFASLGRAAAVLAVSAGSAYLFTRPLWVRAGGIPALGRNLEASARGVDQLTAFGLFFFLAIAWWLASVSGKLAERGVGRPARWALVLALFTGLAVLAVRQSDVFLAAGVLLFLFAFVALAETREDRLAIGFIATAFFLVLFCQRLYLYDRMNTFFKLYLEAWLLLATATAALVFRSRERRGTVGTWALPARAALLVLLAAALFTSITAARGAVSRHFAPYSGPSLDGLRYLQTLHPGEYRAVLWMRRNIEGTPVVLEAQGPSYQDFGRISMLTGLPTVLGWDYHVKQRGNPDTQIEARRAAVKSIYASPATAGAAALVRRYGVGYIYVGWLERKTYPEAGLAKFRNDPLFQLAYENPETQIYRVAGGPTQDVLIPATETLPEAAAAAAQPQDQPEEKPSIKARASGTEPPYFGLREPRGAAVDGEERLWVADFGNSKLRVFDANGGSLGGWGGRGSGQFGLRELCGVAIQGDALYVADTWNGRVEAFTTTGVPRATATDLYGPRGITVAPDGGVWVTDTGNHRVVSYDALLQHPKIIGRKGTGAGEFSSPIGIAAAPSGAIYVADTVNKRIQVLGSDGTQQGSLPFPGWGVNVEPHLTVGADGTIYATDPGAGAVVALDPSGRVLKRWVTDEAGQKFENPTGITLDRKRRILYVINSGNSSVSKIPL